MNIETLTVKEALERGYTHYSSQDGDEHSRRIDAIDRQYFPDDVYLVDKDNSYAFTISAKSIEELVLEKLIYEQDEVSDPNGKLSELASGANFQSLADDVNNRMSEMKFRDLTDIKLVP